MKKQLKIVTIILLIAFVQTVSGKDATNNNTTIPTLNTAASVSYLTPLEKEVIYEINLLRSNPAKYAINYIEPLAKRYRGNLLYYPGDDPLRTKEGVRAMYECVRVLKKAPELDLIFPNYGLSKAAGDHVKDQSKSGRTGHRGGDSSDIKQRIERYGKWNVRIAENIAYGGLTARQIVIYLLIDDGIKDRGHRKTFMHPDYKRIGVAVGSHPHYNSMWVMDFAGVFTDN